MTDICWKYLGQLQQRLQAMGTQLQIPGECAQLLSRKCQGKDGARQLRRLVQTQVEGPLAGFLLTFARYPAKVKLEMEGDRIVFC